jgi:hypothetical protein
MPSHSPPRQSPPTPGLLPRTRSSRAVFLAVIAGRIFLPLREWPTRMTFAKEVKAVALVAFLALVGLALWATGHLVVR